MPLSVAAGAKAIMLQTVKNYLRFYFIFILNAHA